MAAASVSANNTRIAVATIATDSGTWGNDGGGGGVSDEPDIVYEGGTAQSRKVSTSAVGRDYTHGSGTDMDGTPASTAHMIAKINATNSGALLSRTSPALHLKIGSSSSNYDTYYLFGNDNYPPRGGWQILPIAPSVSGYRDATTGTPPTRSAILYWSLLGDFSSTSKSENVIIDAIDVGLGLCLVGGDGASADGTLADFISYDEGTSTNRFGYVTSDAAGAVAFVIGTLAIGQNSAGTSTLTEFTDSNKTVVWRNGLATTGFHKLLLDMATASTALVFSNYTFVSEGESGNTAGRGYSTSEETRTLVEVTGTAAATNVFNACVFVNFATFALNATSTLTNCAIVNSDQIDTGTGATLTGLTLTGYTGAADSSAILWSAATDPDGHLDDLDITIGSAAHHAIEFGTSTPTTMTIRGMTATGFNASDGQNDSTFYVKRGSGTVTINIIDGSGTFSYKSDGATVNLVIAPVTVKVTVKTLGGSAISGARVFLETAAGGPYPFQASVSISNSGTTATVTHASHGLANNDYVVIRGASHWQNNGVHQITVTGAGEYTYTLASDPGSSPTGSIVSSYCPLYGVTAAQGIVSTSKSYASAQPFTGHVRKSSASPLYKTFPLADNISSTAGYTATVQLVPDE